jgi:hypothetical protein
MKIEIPVALPVTFKPNKFKFAFLLVVSLAFTAAGIFMVTLPDARGLGVGFAAFSGLIAVVFVIMLLPNSAYLTLEETGFTFKSLFRVQTIPWPDVVSFSTVRIRRGATFVVWRYTDERRGNGAWKKLNDVFGDYDAMLPNTYGVNPQELASSMQSVRDQRAFAQQQSS